jgi:hypothetical protein
MTNLHERFKEIVDIKTTFRKTKGTKDLIKSDGKYAWLYTNGSGITTAQWEKAYSGWTRIRGDMLEDIGKLYPELLYWLMTGVEDVEAGHLSMSTYKARNGQDDASVAYLRALSSDKATPEEKEALRTARADAICAAHGRNPLA